MQITRYTNLTEPQFLGCLSAFVDSLSGELNAAAMYLRKLEGRRKGEAFAYEMSLDRHRYGVLTVLDRWAGFAAAFGPHLRLGARQRILDEAAPRVGAAAQVLQRANEVIDASDYSAETVEACCLAFQTVAAAFQEERNVAAQSAKLGPLLPDEYAQARRVFLQDLAAR